MVEEKKVDAVDTTSNANKEVLVKIEVATAKLEAANAQFEVDKAARDAEKVEAKLAGKSDVGVEVKPKKISDREYSERVMAGETPK